MGHRGPVVRPRCIGSGRARTQVPFIHILFSISSLINVGLVLNTRVSHNGRNEDLNAIGNGLNCVRCYRVSVYGRRLLNTKTRNI
jgi:hypothetical protein